MSKRGASGVTHNTALCVVRSVGQDEGLGMQGTLTVNRAEGRIPAAGQDHEEMCRDGGLIPGENEITRSKKLLAPVEKTLILTLDEKKKQLKLLN